MFLSEQRRREQHHKDEHSTEPFHGDLRKFRFLNETRRMIHFAGSLPTGTLPLSFAQRAGRGAPNSAPRRVAWSQKVRWRGFSRLTCPAPAGFPTWETTADYGAREANAWLGYLFTYGTPFSSALIC